MVLSKWTIEYRQNDGNDRLRSGWRKRKADGPSIVDRFKINGCRGDW